MGEITIRQRQEGETYRVNLEKLLDYLDRGRKGRDDTRHKKWLRRAKDADIRAPCGERVDAVS